MTIIKVIKEQRLNNCDEEQGYAVLFKEDGRSLYLKNRREVKALISLLDKASSYDSEKYEGEAEITETDKHHGILETW